MEPKKVSTSFTSTPIVRKQLSVLRAHYGECASQIIVRLIAEAYARLTVETSTKNRA